MILGCAPLGLRELYSYADMFCLSLETLRNSKVVSLDRWKTLVNYSILLLFELLLMATNELTLSGFLFVIKCLL